MGKIIFQLDYANDLSVMGAERKNSVPDYVCINVCCLFPPVDHVLKVLFFPVLLRCVHKLAVILLFNSIYRPGLHNRIEQVRKGQRGILSCGMEEVRAGNYQVFK